MLLDKDSFREVGSIAGFTSYDEEGGIAAFTPANSVGGWGDINGRTVVVCADDFTSRGGHSDGAIGAKSGISGSAFHRDAESRRCVCWTARREAAAWPPWCRSRRKTGESSAKESSGAIKAGRPRVAGGGGSFLPGHLGSSMYAEQLATVPVANMLLGSVVGLGAAKAVLGHFSVMVKDISQLFVAGPPVVCPCHGLRHHERGSGWLAHSLSEWFCGQPGRHGSGSSRHGSAVSLLPARQRL